MDDQVLGALQELAAQVQELHTHCVVQASAFVVLARHLGPARMRAAARDLEVMGAAQATDGWRAGHQSLASALRLAGTLQARRRK